MYNYDVILAHGPGCNDGATSAWAIWRTLPLEYRLRLATQGGFYSTPSYDNEIIDCLDQLFGWANNPFCSLGNEMPVLVPNPNFL